MFELTGKERSPLEALSVVRFGGKTYVKDYPWSIQVTKSRVLQNNPNRVFWMITNNGEYDAVLAFNPNSLPTRGSLLQAGFGYVSMSWEEDGEAVGQELFGMCPVSPTLIQILEVVRE